MYFIIIQTIWIIALSGMIQLLTVDNRGMIVLPLGFRVGSCPALPHLWKWIGIQGIPARVLWVTVSSVRQFRQIEAGYWCWGGESFVLTRTFQSIFKKYHEAVICVSVIPAGGAFKFICFGPCRSTKSSDSVVYLYTSLAQSRNHNPTVWLCVYRDHSIMFGFFSFFFFF